MGRLLDAALLGLAAIGLAALVRTRRRYWVNAAEELDSYPDIMEDTYLLAILDDEGGVLELRSPYPFFGTEWGQFCPVDGDVDE